MLPMISCDIICYLIEKNMLKINQDVHPAPRSLIEQINLFQINTYIYRPFDSYIQPSAKIVTHSQNKYTQLWAWGLFKAKLVIHCYMIHKILLGL